MKIAIDARWIFEEISGIGAYTRELLAGLAALDTPDDYLLLFHSDRVRDRTMAETGLSTHPRVSTRVVPYGVFSAAGQLRLPAFLRREGVAVYHSPNYMVPLLAFPRDRRGAVRCVVTIHDVIPLKFPDFAPRSRKRRLQPVYRALMREIGRRADIIIADSESSRRDVIEHLRLPAARTRDVRTVYCGVAPRFSPARPRVPSTTTGSAERSRTILYVGRADPYKNLAGLVRAFAQARANGLAGIRLVIAGAPDPRYPEAAALARQLGVDGHVRWSGYLSESELVEAYRRADLLALPSRYEGFGLPVVEAMACGTPVVCSDRGSLPEVAGDAARIVDPDDIAGLAREIHSVLTDDALWLDLSRRGLERARLFTWKETAARTHAIYEELR